MASAVTPEVLRAGPLEVRPAAHVAIVGGKTLRLTRHELGLLWALLAKEGDVVTRNELAETAWGRPLAHGDRSVDVYVRRLRRKLGDAAPEWEFIHTHFAFGYRLGPELAESASTHG
jgi:DNA-binding response OmpR family regulator